jgi:catabolite regulation protein CreA
MTEISTEVKLLDVVALTEALAGTALKRGQVGTVVEMLDRDTVEVEFCDDQGRTYAMAAVPIGQLIVLRYVPELAA